VSWWDRWVWSRVQNREALTLEQVLADEARPTAAGEAVTVESALRLSTVWGCVRLLSDSVSTLPLHVYRGEDRDPIGTPPAAPATQRRLPRAGRLALGRDGVAAAARQRLGRGHRPLRRGLLPAQVDLVHPDRVSVTTNGEGRRVIRVNGEEQDPADLWHVKAYPWPGQLEGLSPIAYARESIGLGLGAEKYGVQFFGDAAIPIGVTVELEERADAAWGAWRVSKTTVGDEVLELARDGVPLGLSVGFHEVPGGNCWSPDRRRVTRTGAALDHVAVVRVPAHEGAGVVGVRGAARACPTPALLALARLHRG
jgi:hypothetical protein